MNASIALLTNVSFFGRARTLRSSFGTLWCTLMHDSPMWPIRGRYQCARCFRYHPVRWDRPESNWNYAALEHLRDAGPRPKALSRSDLVRILSRVTAIQGDGMFEQPTTRTRLGCGHEDEVRLGMDPNHAVCASCRANGVRPRRSAA